MGVKTAVGVYLTFVVLALWSTFELHRQASRNLDGHINNLHNSHNIPKPDASHPQHYFSVDILSVSSINQLDLMQAQRDSLATHKSVRNFFNVTELDDADPNCHTDITIEHVEKVSKFCRKRTNTMSPISRYLRGQYANIRWLKKKKNPVGWLCAQVRPYSGLRKAQNHYLQTGEELPEYFLIFDDDTYYNMELFQESFSDVDASIEKVIAGCLVRAPIHMANFTFPFGGFGSVLSKGALNRLFVKRHCPGMQSDTNVAGTEDLQVLEEKSLTINESLAFCNRLKEDNVGELKYFTNGMSVVDLMYKYSSTEKFRKVDEWNFNSGGFCMHSDWVLGYFVNYYNISTHVADSFYEVVQHARFEALNESEIYRKPRGYCRNDGDCKADTAICHRATSEWMRSETERWKLKIPEKFRSNAQKR